MAMVVVVEEEVAEVAVAVAVVVVVEVAEVVVVVAARHLQQEGGPFHLMETVGADEGARVALQLGGGVAAADLARALE